MEHKFCVRVYYEDTDCMGIVYHANYLKYLERARTELMDGTGITIVQWAERQRMFPVYSANLVFRTPARLGDRLVVKSTVTKTSSFRLSFNQRVERETDGKQLVDATVDIVCTDLEGNLKEMPDIPGLTEDEL
jgi:tol-pal system-associated acyl-CoA thioesterase